MWNSLPSISIRNPVFAWMLMSSLIIFGGISFTRMGVSQLPDVDFPFITISVGLEGAAPEVLESTVVDVLEGQLTSVEGVKTLTSSVRTGNASITLEFEVGRDLDLALQDVQSKVSAAQRRLPKDIEPPSISKTNPEDQPILWLGINTDSEAFKSQRDFNTYVRDNIRDQFTTLPGVGEVFMGGFVEPNLRVWIDPDKLTRHSLTVSDILNTISAEHAEPPSGTLESGTRELNVRTLGEAKTIQDFKNLRIITRGGAPNFLPIRISDVTRIEPGLNDIRRISRVDGKPSLGLGIKKQRGANAVEVADLVKKKMELIRKDLPKGMSIRPVFDSTVFIREAVSELNFTLVLAALLTSVVLLLFLGSFANTLNVLLSIPTSIVGSFIILYFSGFTLNTFTLLALSLAIGIVVDDAIMVLENIMRHREMGKSSQQAALDGSNEIVFAAMAATFSIVAIFLPVVFMKGLIGKFFFQFGITMTAAVLLSLVEAITLTPMRAAALGSNEGRKKSFLDPFMERAKALYHRTLVVALSHRWKVLLAALVIFLGSLGLSKTIRKEFLPPEDQSRFLVRFTTPVGSSLGTTNEKMKLAEEKVRQYAEVAGTFSAVGGFSGGEVNSGIMFVTLTDKKTRVSQFEVMDRTRNELSKIEGVRISIQDLSARAFSSGRGYPIEFAIQGSDWEALSAASEKIQTDLEKLEGLVDVDSSDQKGMPEIQIFPDRTQAANRGVSIQQIGQTINAMIGGTLAGYYTEGGRRNEIRVKLEEHDTRPYSERIGGLTVRNNRGELLPLREVVEVRESKSLQQITRRDRQRAISIYSNVKAGVDVSKAMTQVEAIARKHLPEGYKFVPTGTSQSSKETFQSLMVALFLGIVVAYMILGSQFNSFIDPVSVLLALPFSISGAFLALGIFQKSINLYSMIGILLLMGIVKKNSILLVEFTHHLRDQENLEVDEAIKRAGLDRLRPILMTSLSTIVGALPAAFAWGPGAESRSPMAIAVIGGVLLSTLLTLVVVPCFYSLFAVKRRLRA